MMLFKLSFKNIRKSFKDYSIYFLTLVLGVAIFYMFNSLDSQQAMLVVSKSQQSIIELMINMLSYISVFVAIILALLIVYANNFLINRRKKEFGIYMTLGMGKRQISKIILVETFFVGLISLIVGLIIGIFASQFMSVFVAKLFEANMKKFEFIFSKESCIKTCIYFAIMYFTVMIFNTMTISRYKLINLLNASKKNEKVKVKNPIISAFIFAIACIILGVAYWKVTKDVSSLNSAQKLLAPILLGVLGTFLVFWSVSGFLLQIIQAKKSVYLKGTNMFVLRQINNKVNTMVVSMSVICLMLFMTITILSSSVSLRNTMQRDLKEMTPVDINLYKNNTENSKESIQKILSDNGFNPNLLKDVIEIPIYSCDNLTCADFFGSHINEIQEQYPFYNFNAKEQIVKISDYNKIAKEYGFETYSIKDDEYIVICDYDGMITMRNKVLQKENSLKIVGKTLKPKYKECKDGYIFMSASHTNTGIIVVPDSCEFSEDMKAQDILVANYNATKDEEKEKIEEEFVGDESELVKNLNVNNIELEGITKIAIIEGSIGVSTIIIFIAIYLGIIFLIASSAILALKQLTDSSDNKQRYSILRKIGCDEKMINHALGKQIGIFFGFPLILAIIHSVFGIKFVLLVLSGLADTKELIPSIIITVLFMGVIYGAYFVATYIGSKNIIKEEQI